MEHLELTTELGKRLADRIAADREGVAIKHHRLNCVMRELICYTNDYQFDLADAAIVYAFATLATHKNRADCEANFFAYVDLMYSATDDAQRTHSESERQQILVAAEAVAEHLLPKVQSILAESVAELRTLKDKNNPFLMAATLLGNARTQFVEHANVPQKIDLIYRCVFFGMETDRHEWGLGSQEAVMKSLYEVIASLTIVTKHVYSRLERKELVVVDGTIVDPTKQNDGRHE